MRCEAGAVLIGNCTEIRPERLTADERLAIVAENAGCIFNADFAVHIDVACFIVIVDIIAAETGERVNIDAERHLRVLRIDDEIIVQVAHDADV